MLQVTDGGIMAPYADLVLTISFLRQAIYIDELFWCYTNDRWTHDGSICILIQSPDYYVKWSDDGSLVVEIGSVSPLSVT